MTDHAAKGGRDGDFPAPQSASDARRITVWDPFVRLFHWSLALLIALAWLTSDELKNVHQAIGLTIAGLVALRIIWGLVGPRHARFSGFLRGPRATLAYLRRMTDGTEPRYLGHNPAGGIMVVALLMTIGATALTGWLQTTDAFWGSDALEDIHEALATLILVLVAGHLGGVLLASLRHGENLVRAMIDGQKAPLAPNGDQD